MKTVKYNSESNAQFLDWAIHELWLKNDLQLARKLKMTSAHMSWIRSGKSPVGAIMIARLHSLLPNVSIKELVERSKYAQHT